MIMVFDLASQERELTHLVNSRKYVLDEIEISCSKEGFTTALVHYDVAKYPEPPKKRNRIIRRFLFEGTENEQLNSLLRSGNIRINEEFQFTTEIGVVIVLDYEE